MFAIQTSRLILRDFVEADWTVIWEMSQAAEVTRYQTWLQLHSEAEARRWVQDAIHHNQLQPRHTYNLAVTLESRPTGWIGWGRPSDPALGDYDFGYALLPSAWGHGYMTEALRAAGTFMFMSLGAERIFGQCESGNRPSARVMEKIGMKLVATWREQAQPAGVVEEHRRYALDRTEWRHEAHDVFWPVQPEL